MSVVYVKENYKGKTIKGDVKITRNDDKLAYDAEVNDKYLIFDKNGNFLKKVKG